MYLSIIGVLRADGSNLVGKSTIDMKIVQKCMHMGGKSIIIHAKPQFVGVRGSPLVPDC